LARRDPREALEGAQQPQPALPAPDGLHKESRAAARSIEAGEPGEPSKAPAPEREPAAQTPGANGHGAAASRVRDAATRGHSPREAAQGSKPKGNKAAAKSKAGRPLTPHVKARQLSSASQRHTSTAPPQQPLEPAPVLEPERRLKGAAHEVQVEGDEDVARRGAGREGGEPAADAARAKPKLRSFPATVEGSQPQPQLLPQKQHKGLIKDERLDAQAFHDMMDIDDEAMDDAAAAASPPRHARASRKPTSSAARRSGAGPVGDSSAAAMLRQLGGATATAPHEADQLPSPRRDAANAMQVLSLSPPPAARHSDARFDDMYAPSPTPQESEGAEPAYAHAASRLHSLPSPHTPLSIWHSPPLAGDTAKVMAGKEGPGSAGQTRLAPPEPGEWAPDMTMLTASAGRSQQSSSVSIEEASSERRRAHERDKGDDKAGRRGRGGKPGAGAHDSTSVLCDVSSDSDKEAWDLSTYTLDDGADSSRQCSASPSFSDASLPPWQPPISHSLRLSPSPPSTRASPNRRSSASARSSRRRSPRVGAAPAAAIAGSAPSFSQHTPIATGDATHVAVSDPQAPWTAGSRPGPPPPGSLSPTDELLPLDMSDQGRHLARAAQDKVERRLLFETLESSASHPAEGSTSTRDGGLGLTQASLLRHHGGNGGPGSIGDSVTSIDSTSDGMSRQTLRGSMLESISSREALIQDDASALSPPAHADWQRTGSAAQGGDSDGAGRRAQARGMPGRFDDRWQPGELLLVPAAGGDDSLDARLPVALARPGGREHYIFETSQALADICHEMMEELTLLRRDVELDRQLHHYKTWSPRSITDHPAGSASFPGLAVSRQSSELRGPLLPASDELDLTPPSSYPLPHTHDRTLASSQGEGARTQSVSWVPWFPPDTPTPDLASQSSRATSRDLSQTPIFYPKSGPRHEGWAAARQAALGDPHGSSRSQNWAALLSLSTPVPPAEPAAAFLQRNALDPSAVIATPQRPTPWRTPHGLHRSRDHSPLSRASPVLLEGEIGWQHSSPRGTTTDFAVSASPSISAGAPPLPLACLMLASAPSDVCDFNPHADEIEQRLLLSYPARVSANEGAPPKILL